MSVTSLDFIFISDYKVACIYEVCVCVVMIIYRKIASSNTSHLEAHAGIFRLLMKGIFDPYVRYCALLNKVDFLICKAL